MRLITLKIFVVLAAGFACINAASTEKEFLQSIDVKLENAWQEGSVPKFAEAKKEILEWCGEQCSSSKALWRLARCCYFITEWNKDMPDKDKYALMKEGYNYAEKAVTRNDTDPEAHKWMAVLSGHKGSFEGGKNKLYGGVRFYTHVNRALQLNPKDPTLHYLKGYFQLELGKLIWVQKTAIARICSDFPSATTKDAIESFLCADRLFKKPRKINSAYLAISYYANKNRGEARKWLQKAEDIGVENFEDAEAAKVLADLRKSLKP